MRSRRGSGHLRGRETRLTRRGWALLAAGLSSCVASYALGRQELVYLGSFLVLLPLVALASVRVRPLRLSVQRSFSPAVVSVGYSAMVDLRIENRSRSATTEARWRDVRPWHPDANEPASLPGLPSHSANPARRGAHALIRYELTPSTRGSFDIGPMILDFSDPFGLADGSVTAGSSDLLTVIPAVVPLAENIVSLSTDGGPTRTVQRRALGGDDDLMTRQYRRGDALRRVHWRATARAGELMVRQEEQRSHAEARILLDTRRANYRDVQASDTFGAPLSEAFECAVRFTASLGIHLARGGHLVRVIETARAQLGSPEHPEEFLESLASVRLTAEPPQELSLLGGVQRPDRAQGAIFAVLSEADNQIIERLSAQRRAFGVAAVFLIAPRQDAVAQALREAGWTCVIVRPGDPIERAWLALGVAQGEERTALDKPFDREFADDFS